MCDFIDQYRKRVQKRLSRKENEPVVRMVEILCLPSFHAETLLRIVERPDGTAFRLFTLTENLWFAHDKRAVQRFQESTPVSKRRADKFWNLATDTAILEIKDEYIEILDGMTLLVAMQIDGTFIDVETNDLVANKPLGLLLRKILDEGKSVLREAISRKRLKELWEY